MSGEIIPHGHSFFTGSSFNNWCNTTNHQIKGVRLGVQLLMQSSNHHHNNLDRLVRNMDIHTALQYLLTKLFTINICVKREGRIGNRQFPSVFL